ncbi:MAG: histidine kinase, partial [Terriglobales bacterium]
MARWRSATVIIAVFAAFGTLSFSYHYLDDRANGFAGTARLRAMTEYTGAFAGLVIFFALLWLVRRYPVRRGAWHKSLLLYLGAMPLLGACNTTLILLSRKALAPLLGLAHYSYGDLWFRYPMEFSYQIILYVMMIGGILLADLYRENYRRELAAARLQQELARSELQNLRLQLQPHFLFNALNTISAVMYEDVSRADAMLTGLSELLRRALATSETQEVPLADELATARLY